MTSFTRDFSNQLRQSQHKKNVNMNTTTSTKSFDQFIMSSFCSPVTKNAVQQQTTNGLQICDANVMSNSSDVYNVPWDIKSKLLRQQQESMDLNSCGAQSTNPIDPTSSQNLTSPNDDNQPGDDEYCAPWDLKMQEERIRQLSKTNTSVSVPPVQPTPPKLPQQTVNKTIDEPQAEYSPPWEHKQTIMLGTDGPNTCLIKSRVTPSSHSSNSSLSSTSTCSPVNLSNGQQQQQQTRIIIVQSNNAQLQGLDDFNQFKYCTNPANANLTMSAMQQSQQQNQQSTLAATTSANTTCISQQIDKFCSWGSNRSSNTSSFERLHSSNFGMTSCDDTKPLVKPRTSSQRIIIPIAQSSTSSLLLTQQQQQQHVIQQPPPLPLTPAYMVTLEKQVWFHGRITRKQAEILLTNKPIGSFLVRQSESGTNNDFSLSLVTAGGCVHMRICLNDDMFVLGQCSQPFSSIIKMIEHFSKVEVPIKGAQHVRLSNPIRTV